jgi:type II secretory ATPase GspE/PulE/Tfp pilus assembly ATPase PilB-like protein
LATGSWILVFIVVACAALGLAALTAAPPASRVEAVMDVLSRSFEGPGWELFPHVLGAAAVAALLLTLAPRVARGARQSRSALPETSERGPLHQRVAVIGERVEAHLRGGQGDIVRAFDDLVRGALSVGASDIHFSPTPEGLRLTYRVQGTLYPIARLGLEYAPRLTTRVKVLARLDTYVHAVPQDGRLIVTIDGAIVEARVSTLPTETGERVVLRFVRGVQGAPDLASLGFSDDLVKRVQDLLERPQGLVFLSAPVGSGKTTTLYAAMKHVAEKRGRTTTLVTLEDPIELELPFATQTQMHRRSGMTFAATLRSVLRQDPNVLMLGEIRDRETAEIAMQAGHTGHLILTTVHGDGAAGAFARMTDMGVQPYLLASATIGSLSQRLVRTLCTACRREAPVDLALVGRLEELGLSLPDGKYFEAVGCDYCEGTGFAGRAPIAELLVASTRVRSAIQGQATTETIEAIAREEGMVPLVLDGLTRAARGETPVSEVLRVSG